MGYSLIHRQTQLNKIFKYMSEGQSLRKACSQEDVQTTTKSFLEWLASSQDFSIQYARAIEERGLFLFEECLTISDAKDQDMYFIDKNGNERIDNGKVTWLRDQVNTRKWFLSKLLPKKYADKLLLDTTTDGGKAQGFDLSIFQPDTLSLMARDAKIAEDRRKTLTAAAISSGDTEEVQDITHTEEAK